MGPAGALRSGKVTKGISQLQALIRILQLKCKCMLPLWHTATSINVVGSKLQANATRPNGSVGRSRRLLHGQNTNEV